MAPSSSTTPPTSGSLHSNLPPTFVSGKAALAPAEVDNEQVELRDMVSSGPTSEMALKDDIMKLAMHGDELAVRALLDSGTVSACYQDSDGLTPLHWAAINNRYGVVKMLLDEGADANAHGGDSDATPAMWAAQRGHYYIVHYLLSRGGADPMMVDSSGYNMLHLATFDGNLLLLVLLLHQGIPVDSRDPQMHTALMWAAYKGFPACVDLFLRWGADIRAVDDTGFTALHWALVRGNYGCIEKLLEYGVDRFAPNNDGKTPAAVAAELKTQRVWWDALDECGFDRNGHQIHQQNTLFGIPTQDKDAGLRRFFFLWPAVQIFAVIQIMTYFEWYLAIPISLCVEAGFHWMAMQALQWAPPGEKAIHKTPYLAGIFACTAFWIAIRWIWSILPNTFWNAPFSNLFFLFNFACCMYLYAICMVYDPGYVPRPSGLNEQKKVIHELLTLWKYDEQNFCVKCMLRMPLRSKHCRRCNRCVAKHDHHCPWVFNCIAVANHRQFFLYIVTLEICIFTLIRLVVLHAQLLPPVEPAPTCAFLIAELCQPLWQDPFTFYISLWGALQATWVTMLLIVQLVQVAKAQTTHESMSSSNHHHHNHHNHHNHHLGKQHTAATLATAIATGSISPDTTGDPDHLSSRYHVGWWSRTKRLLGVDVFWRTAAAEQQRRGGIGGGGGPRNRNPFSVGVIRNCRDFWGGAGKPWRPPLEGGLGAEGRLAGRPVDWTSIYETPKMTIRGGGMV